MRIGEAAAAAGTTARALRFYEQRGLLPPPVRTASGQREYGPDDVARVRIIRDLLSLGLTVEDLRSCADRLHLLAEDPPPRCGSVEPGDAASGVVGRRLAALDAEISRLAGLRESLAQRAAGSWPAGATAGRGMESARSQPSGSHEFLHLEIRQRHISAPSANPARGHEFHSTTTALTRNSLLDSVVEFPYGPVVRLPGDRYPKVFMTVPPTLPKVRQQLILAVLMVCSLLIWLDNTVLSTALETLADPARGLGADPGQLQWATGSYTLAFATLMFTAGALGDRFGHRTVFSAGLVVFAGSSLWAAYASDAGQLIAARAAMGVGSALITPANLAILMWTFTGPARAAAIGIFSTAAGVGMAAGPVLAGFLLDHFWWGSVFLINVPIAVSALVGLAVLVPNFRSPTPRPLDPAGMLLSVSGLVALAYGLIRAGQAAAWSRTDVWAPVVAGLVLLAVFVLAELRVKTPGFDPRLLAQRAFGGGNAALGLLLFAVAAITFYNAFYLQGALGFSPMKAGLANIPTAFGALAGAPLGSRLVRRLSLRPVAVPALTVAALTMGGYGLLGLQTPLLWIEILLLVQGLSIGVVIGPVTAALIGNLPLEQAGAGSAVTNTVRQTGSLIGIAVGGTIMSITYRRAIGPSLAGAPRPVQDQARVSAEQARHVATAAHRPALARAADHAFVHAMHVGAGWIAAVALLGAAVLLIAVPAAGKKYGAVPEPDREEVRSSA